MIDILKLLTVDDGNKYCLMCVDLASHELDAQEWKKRTPTQFEGNLEDIGQEIHRYPNMIHDCKPAAINARVFSMNIYENIISIKRC